MKDQRSVGDWILGVLTVRSYRYALLFIIGLMYLLITQTTVFFTVAVLASIAAAFIIAKRLG